MNLLLEAFKKFDEAINDTLKARKIPVKDESVDSKLIVLADEYVAHKYDLVVIDKEKSWEAF